MADHGEGQLEFSTKTKLQDAQGSCIPTRCAKSAEISLHDLDGREDLENMTFSSKVNQPILCYGRLMVMEHGWGINGREQMLENGDLKVPLNLQNRPLTVQGRIRVVRDEDESSLEVQVPEALEKEPGWRFNEHELPFLQSQSSVTSQYRRKIWGSLHQDTRSLRTKAIGKITPTPPETEVQGQQEEEKKDDDLECKLQLSPMGVDKVLVNGVELTKDSSLATLRAACSFLGIPGSGPKVKSTERSSIATRRWSCRMPKSSKSKRTSKTWMPNLGQVCPHLQQEERVVDQRRVGLKVQQPERVPIVEPNEMGVAACNSC